MTKKYFAVNAAVATILFSSNAIATNYYVATSGNNSWPGTQAQPWRTVTKCVQTIVGGDTCFVGDGDYTNEGKISWTRDGTGTSSVMYIRSTNQYGAKIKGFNFSGADYVRASYFDIQNLANNNACVSIGGGSDYVTITHNRIQFCTFGGIETDTTTTHANINQNTFYRNAQEAILLYGASHTVSVNTVTETIDHHPCNPSYLDWYDADGIRTFGNGHLIENNTINVGHGVNKSGETGGTCSVSSLSNTSNDFIGQYAHPDCIQTWADPALTNATIRGNICHALDYNPASDMPAKFIDAGGATNINIYNNVVDATLVAGFADSDSITIQNNTFVSSETMTPYGGLGIQLTNTPNSVVKNNVFAHINGNGNAIVYYEDQASLVGAVADYNCYNPQGTPQGPNDVYGLIYFINEAGKNYRLNSTSSCRDQGETITTITTDRDGISRPQGSAYDMGAYEQH